jgi:NADH:ubiquinone oxidoreductase subunit K
MIAGIPITHFLIVSTLVFFIGINRYLYPDQLQGHFFALFIVAIAAAEASVAIALIINIYRRFTSIEVEDVDEMKY